MIRRPSVKTLVEAFRITPDEAMKIRQCLDCRSISQLESLTGETISPYASLTDEKMEAVSDIIHGYGVEYIASSETRSKRGLRYINTGDTYSATILRTSPNYYIIGCWGDLVK